MASLERIEISAGIICRHGLILACQRPDDKPYAGYWELPGGKREGNETPNETLCRELAEELGINVLSSELLQVIEHNYPESGFTAVLHFFHVSSFQGEPCALEEQNLRWISLSEISEFDFLPADTRILERLADTGLNGEM